MMLGRVRYKGPEDGKKECGFFHGSGRPGKISESFYFLSHHPSGNHDGDYLTISSDNDRIIFRKAKIEVDYENPDDAWQAYAKNRLAHD